MPAQPGRGRRRRHRPRARLGLGAARRQGHRGRVSRHDPRRHGRRGRQAVPAHARQAGHRVPPRLQGDRRRQGARRARRSPSSRSRAALPRRSRPTSVLVATGRKAFTDKARPRRGRRRARRARPRQGRRASADQRAGHLRDRRRDRRADAGAQGRGRGRGGRRDHRRPGRPRELRRHPERRLHQPGSRLGRQDRGGAEGGRHRLQGRQVSRSPPTAALAPCCTPTAS